MMAANRWWLVFSCLAWLFVSQAAAETSDATQLDRMFRRTTIQIATPNARLHTFTVWVADSYERRARGLMHVKHLADDQGMLFIYEQPQVIGMWMKNTYIPLDMVFVDASGKVINVVRNTEPHSLKTIESLGEALGVIELKGGMTERLGITKGARVLETALGPWK